MPGGGAVLSTSKDDCFCHICNSMTTSSLSMRQHLCGQNHQKKARGAPFTKHKPHSEYIVIDVTDQLSQVDMSLIYEALEKFGHLGDYRFTQAEKGKLLKDSKIFLKYTTVAAAEQLLQRCQQDQVKADAAVIRAQPVSGQRPSAAAEAPKKKKEKKVKNPPAGAPDPIDHIRLLSELARQVRRKTEDDTLSWLAEQLLLTPDQHRSRVELCGELQSALRSRFRTCLVQAFGSSVSGLGFRGCDLDLYAYIDPRSPGSRLPPNATDQKKVGVVAEMLYRLPHLCSDIVRIPQARVPIVKFRAVQLDGIQCDMSFKDPMSCQNSRLVGWLMRADPRVRPLTVAVRYWAKRRNLAGGEFHPGRMSSYCVTLLVVTFLQQLRPPVLPSVDWCQDPVEALLIGPWNAAFDQHAVWHSDNATPTSQLLRQFFRFYARFPSASQALCPLLGGPVPRGALTDREAGGGMLRPGVWAGFCDLVADGRVEAIASDKPLVVQDPMELNFNVARSYRQPGLDRFQQSCREAEGMPIERLFDEQKMPRMRMKESEKEAAAAARAVRAAARAAAGDSKKGGRTAKRSLESPGDRSEEPEAKKSSPSAEGGGQCAVVSSSREDQSSREERGGDSKPAEAVNGGSGASQAAAEFLASLEKPAKLAAAAAAAGSVPPSAAGKPPAGGGGGGGPAGAAVSITADAALLSRVLADFDRPPSHVISFGLHSGSHGRGRSAAAACARFLEDIFTTVMRFQCRVMTFDGLDLPMNVVRGYSCEAHMATWEYRKIAAQMVGKHRRIEFEAEVTERALRMGGRPTSKEPMACFSCYLVLEASEIKVCYYEGETMTAGKNCHNFMVSFLKELGRNVNFVTLYGENAALRK